MPISGKEADKNFKEALKNPVKPINDTEPSPEMKEYLKKQDSGELVSEETQKKLERQKQAEEEDKFQKCCPKCRRPTLKRTPQMLWACGFCGHESTSPTLIAPK